MSSANPKTVERFADPTWRTLTGAFSRSYARRASARSPSPVRPRASPR